MAVSEAEKEYRQLHKRVFDILEPRAGDYSRQHHTIPEEWNAFYEGVDWAVKKLIKLKMIVPSENLHSEVAK